MSKKPIPPSSDREKMSAYFSKQKSSQSLQQQQGSASQSRQYEDSSNVYNYSEVTEKNEEQDDNLAIVQFVENAGEVPQEDKRQRDNSKRKSSKPHFQKKNATQKPYSYNKLNEKGKEQVFLDVYDENIQLKRSQKSLESHYRELETKFKHLEKHMGAHKTIHKGKTLDEEPAEMYSMKQQLEQQELENQRLKQKIMAISQAKQIISSSNIKKPQKKTLISSDKADERRAAPSSSVGEGQIKDLLKLNDMLKKRCLEQESQIRSLQAMMNSKVMANKELSDKNTQFVTMKERYEKLEQHLQAQKMLLDEERKRQSEIMALLRDEREQKHSLEQQIRATELTVKSAQDLQQDLQDCRRQKNELEERFKILMESPFFRDYNEKASTQAKLQTLELQLNSAQLEMRSLREKNIQFETENKLKRQECDSINAELKKKYEECKELSLQLNERDKQLAPFKDLNYWDNDQFLKVLGNLKWTGEDPAWRKIEFIDRTYLESDDPNVLRKEIEHLKLEKGELAAHLEKTQTLLKTRGEIEMEREKMLKEELNKVTLQLKAALAKNTELAKIADLHVQAKQQKTMYEQGDTKYDGSVSVFSVDPEEEDELQPGENYFDLWIGNAELDSAGLLQSYKHHSPTGAIDMQTLITFMTIDFYDHDTQRTNIAEGTHCSFNLQVAFKVTGDAPFIQYLESGYLKLELFMSQGSEAIKLAQGLEPLRELVLKNQIDGQSAVKSGQIELHGNNDQMVGVVYFKFRMRLPISQVIRWLKEQRELDIKEYEELDDMISTRRRKLVVVIDKATQLPPKSNTFVYYSMDNKDYNTSTQPGSTPRWDYRNVHEILFNEEFASMIKNNKYSMEFFIIDDNQPLTADGSTDKVGVAYVDLSPLLRDDAIDVAAEIKNDQNSHAGSLFIKVFWYESQRDEPQMPQEKGLIQQSWEETITSKIGAEMRTRSLTLQSAFKIIDKDNDQIINFDDFVNALKNIFGIRLNNNEMQLYFAKLPQPFNQPNFESIFRPYVQSNIGNYMEQDPAQGLSRINQLVQQNTQLLQSEDYGRIEMVKRNINEVLMVKIRQGKKKTDLFREIDSTKPDGFITVEELQGWLRFQGLTLTTEDIKIFISSYVDHDYDGRVNIKEFFTYVLGGMGDEITPSHKTTLKPRIDPIQLTLDTILEFGRDNKMPLMRVREKMDKNKNGFVERFEMKQFLLDFGVKLSEPELMQVVDHFDTNGDGRISVQEFADALNTENRKQKINNEKQTFDNINSYIVGYLISYMKKKNYQMSSLFNEIDQNSDGYLSKEEMKEIFRNKIIVPLDKDEFQMFFDRFDADKDGRISIKEFVSVIQPLLSQQGYTYDQRKKSMVTIAEKVDIENLKRRVDLILSDQQRAKRILDLFSDRQVPQGQGFITRNEFINIIKSEFGFSTQETTSLIDEMCDKNSIGQINFYKFLDQAKKSGDLFEQTTTSMYGNLSQFDLERGQKKTKEIFRRIKTALKKNVGQADLKKLFRGFDKDGDGNITKEELGIGLNKMKFGLSEQEVDLVFKSIDRNGDGQIEIDEFVKAVEAS